MIVQKLDNETSPTIIGGSLPPASQFLLQGYHASIFV